MKIQTYEIEETSSEIATLAADGEAMQIIDSLNLVGQLGLTNKETDTRFPYRKMTKAEREVFGVICPYKTRIENYSDGLIPVRVLQVAAHAAATQHCDWLEIWHPESSDIKDPFLVGRIGSKQSNGYTDSFYLLARWGEELLPFEQMEAIAQKIKARQLVAKLKGILAEVQADLATVVAAQEAGDVPLHSSPYYGGFR
jgi:hypothetical protein